MKEEIEIGQRSVCVVNSYTTIDWDHGWLCVEIVQGHSCYIYLDSLWQIAYTTKKGVHEMRGMIWQERRNKLGGRYIDEERDASDKLSTRVKYDKCSLYSYV